MVLCLVETQMSVYKWVLQGTDIGFDASLEEDIFMEHKNLNVQVSELSSNVFFSGTFPALFQMWNTCKVVADWEFQQLVNFKFTFKASAEHRSSMAAPIHW